LGQQGADVPKLVDRVKALTTQQLVIGTTGIQDDGSGDIRDRPDAAAVSCPLPDARAVALGTYGSFNRGITGHTWGGSGASPQTTTDTARYVGLARRARGLAVRPGLSSAFYKQLTDVENELDGLVTYDRQVAKVVAKTVADANTDVMTPIVPVIQLRSFATPRPCRPRSSSSPTSTIRNGRRRRQASATPMTLARAFARPSTSATFGRARPSHSTRNPLVD
jgi:hypothetical protein